MEVYLLRRVFEILVATVLINFYFSVHVFSVIFFFYIKISTWRPVILKKDGDQ